MAGNLSLRCKDLPVTAAGDAIRALADLDWERVAADAARDMARGMLSKFQPCLPEDAEDRLLAERLLDRPGTLRFLASVKVNGVRVAARPSGTRLADVEATGPMPLEFAPAARSRCARHAAQRGAVDRHASGPPRRQRGAARRRCRRARRRDGARFRNAVPAPDRHSRTDVPRRPVRGRRPRSRLVDVLSGTRPLKVIHNARFERRVLAAVGIALDGVFDTLEASRQARGADALGGHSLAMVCERELGIALDKSSQTSNWSRRPLDADQLRYAALDAEVLLALYDHSSKLLAEQRQDEQVRTD